ncbi:MAG: PKD domain-containing protein [Rhodocyclaceae bacterium]|nr:PKD domain-containing protein [Rhodocyclaceae bacterium]
MHLSTPPAASLRTLRHLLLALALGPVVAFAASAYQLIDLGVDVSPSDINDNGTVVGWRPGAGGRIAIRIPRGGNVEDLDGASIATAVNDDEIITGNTLTGAFLYDGSLRDLGDGHSGGDINAFGVVAGSAVGTNPYRASPLPVNPARYDPAAHGRNWQVLDVAKVYPRGTRQGVYADLYYLLGINDAGYAVGRKRRYGLAGSAAILTTPSLDGVTFLPIPSGGAAVAINNANKVVGTNGERYAHAYLYAVDSGTYTDLGTLDGGLRSSSADINDADQVVGSAWLSTVETSLYDPTLYHAFVWDAASGMVDLNDLAAAPGWLLTAATAINARGEIVGTAIKDGQLHGFLLSNDAPPPPADNRAPVASATADVTSGRAPLTVNFSAGATTDPDGDPLTYGWDFGDGSTASGPSAAHTYVDAGTFQAVLTVSDGLLSDTAALEIRVRKRQPTK